MGMTVAKHGLHLYEEPPICHTNGAGAIFFGGCSLRCVFCQNYEVSRAERGKAISPKELTVLIEELEEAGADCIDLVTCDHVLPEVLESLAIHRPRVPVVLNTGSYIKTQLLREADPYIDVYLPDLKFVSAELSERYTGRRDYFGVAKEAIRFMAEKPVRFGKKGELISGILARHLVMPGCTSDSLLALDFLKETLPPEAPVSVMRQYTPMGAIENFPELQRRVTAREYRRVADYALSLGFGTLYTQGGDSATKDYIPDWD